MRTAVPRKNLSLVTRAIAVAVAVAVPGAALASAWNPTLLVNTESFQAIHEGDGSTDVELRFGDTLNEKLIWNRSKGSFQFTDDLSVLGTLSGTTLRVDGEANIHGALTASGTVRFDANLTINDDAGAADAIFTFGNDAGNETLKFSDTFNEFEFSDDVRVTGNLSGSGDLNLEGTLTGATIAGFGLTDCDAGSSKVTWDATTKKFICASSSVGNGSGGIIALNPEYAGAAYFASGSSYVGQLSASGGTSGLENNYKWTSSKATVQDYWISVRVRLPDNFSTWDPVRPIQLRYKTGVSAAANNHVTVRMRDTAGSLVTLTSGSALASTSFATATITGPESAGTWTPKSYFTVYVKLAADNTAAASAHAGYLQLNFETTTP